MVGRENDHITFIRAVDNQRFRYAIANLSTPDQEWARTLAITVAAPPANPAVEATEPDRPSFEEAEIRKVEEEIEKTRRLLREIPDETIKWRTEWSHLQRLKNRLARLKKRTR